MLRSNQLGENAAIKIFDMEQDLLRLAYIDPMTGTEVSLDRHSVRDVETQKKLDRLREEKRLRDKLNEQSILNSKCSILSGDRHMLSQIKKVITSTNSKTIVKKLYKKVPYAVGFTFGVLLTPVVAGGMFFNYLTSKIKKIASLAGV